MKFWELRKIQENEQKVQINIGCTIFLKIEFIASYSFETIYTCKNISPKYTHKYSFMEFLTELE